MCEPTTLFAVSTALTIGTAGLQYMGQAQQAAAQGKANKLQAQNINDATRRNLEQIGLQRSQERDAASQKAIEAQRKTLAAKERARVSAGEAGVGGLSVDALLADYERQNLEYDTTLQGNLKNNEQQRQLEAEGVIAQGQSRINSMPLPDMPSLAGTALSVAGSTFNSYDRYMIPRDSKGNRVYDE